MKNELLTIGPVTIHGYGLMIGIGVIAAYLTAEYRARKLKLDADQVFSLVIWCLVFGGLGSKLLFCLTQLDTILADPSYLLHSLANGWVVYGGLIGGVLGGFLFCRHKKINFLSYFDLALPSVALAQGFGRLGSLVEERPVIGGEPGDEQGVEGQAQSQKGPQGRQAEEFPPLIDRQIHGCPSR